MLKIRRPLGRLIFNMGIAIPGKTFFLIETAPRIQYLNAIFNLVLMISIFSSSNDDAFRWMSQDLTYDVNIGSGNGLVLWGNKRLSEPMLTQI